MYSFSTTLKRMESRLDVMEKKMAEMEKAVFAKGGEAKAIPETKTPEWGKNMERCKTPEWCKPMEWYQAWVQCQAKRLAFYPETRTGAFLCPAFPLICMHDPEREFPFQWMRLPSWVKDAAIKWNVGLDMEASKNDFWSAPVSELAQKQRVGRLLESIPSEIGAMKNRVINMQMIEPTNAPVICAEMSGSGLCPETLTVEFLCLYPCFPANEAENWHTPISAYDYEDHKVLSMHLLHAE